MGTIATATVPAEQFALAETFRRLPDVEFRVVRLVAHSAGHVMPFLWVECDDIDRVYRAVEDDETVDEVDVLGEFDGQGLLRVRWETRVRVVAAIIGKQNATILDATGQDGTWVLQVFFPSHDGVSSTETFCVDYGIDISIDRVDRLSKTSEYGHLGLTERQYETLVSAYRRGYYDVPRAVNQEELADHFDVSHQAISERLRRAHQTVIRNDLYHKIHRRDDTVLPGTRPEIDS